MEILGTNKALTPTGLIFPTPVNEVISDIVGNVSQRILPQLQAYNAGIQCINFMFGHQIEVKNILAGMATDPTLRNQRFPLVFLQADIRNDPPTVKNLYSDVTLQIFILYPTDSTWTVGRRNANNFVPILRPIYQCLIQEIAKSSYFWIQSVQQILGHDIEHWFYGSDKVMGGTGSNPFNDYVDCIEIKNLRLTVCRPGNSIPENSFTQFVEFYLMNTRATITITSVTDNTIGNVFFKNKITEITTQMQDYIAGIDFTQNVTAGTITGINIEFQVDQVMIAKR